MKYQTEAGYQGCTGQPARSEVAVRRAAFTPLQITHAKAAGVGPALSVFAG
jgi:hypothetical protein